MTRDDIIRMAREAKIPSNVVDIWFGQISDFSALVAAAEREACAKVCDGKVDAEYATGKVDHNEMSWSMACAIAIRARGNNEQG